MDVILSKHIQNNIVNNIGVSDFVLSNFQLIKLEKNKLLVEIGEVNKYVYFVSKGCLQTFLYDHEMREVTRDIIIENSWYFDLQSFDKKEKAVENVRTLEFTELYRIRKQEFQILIDNVPQFAKIYQKMLEANYCNAIHRVDSFISLNAIDRIKWLIKYRPGLIMRVSSKVIASYLGINKDVYSKLKNKL